jgi:hypothetical protein
MSAGGWWRAIVLGFGAAVLLVASARTPASEVPAPAPAASVAPAMPAMPAAAPAAEPIVCPPEIERLVAAPAVDRGLLWRISRDGRHSYLFGTIHVGRPSWRTIGPRTAAALRETDVTALEIDPLDPVVVAALALSPLAPPLPDALRQRLQRATERACLPRAALAALHPVLQATTLTLLDARWLGLDPAYSIEMLLAGRARSSGRRVISLESIEQQQAALVPAEPAEALALIEQALEQIESLGSRRMLGRLVAAWERGDLEALEDYPGWCECAHDEADRAFLRRLNDERNPHLARGIAELHLRGRRVFAAVGVLHMTGPQALPRLLQAQGFVVERVAFRR